MTTSYSYQESLAASERVSWRIEDLIGGDKRLDFSKPLLPESLARVESLPYLTPAEKRTLNQIRGHAYLCIFGLVEEVPRIKALWAQLHLLKQEHLSTFRLM